MKKPNVLRPRSVCKNITWYYLPRPNEKTISIEHALTLTERQLGHVSIEINARKLLKELKAIL